MDGERPCKACNLRPCAGKNQGRHIGAGAVWVKPFPCGRPPCKLVVTQDRPGVGWCKARMTPERPMKPSVPFLALAGLAALIGVVTFAMTTATTLYLTEGRGRAGATLDLTLKVLDGHLRRFEAVPDLLADSDNLRALLDDPEDPARRMALNLWLARKSAQLDASDIYVMTNDGLTVAASNHDRADSFIGENFSYRPYFQEALGGSKGRFFAIGTTSGVRGYYFASPVRDRAGSIAGVVAVKIGLDVIEAEWRSQEARIIVTDPEGIIFLSSYPDWLYRGLFPLTPERINRTLLSRRYADRVPDVLPHEMSDRYGVTRVTLADASGKRSEYIMASKLLPRAEMTVRILQDTGPIYAQARLAVAAFVLLLGGIAAVIVMFLQRRARLAERFAMQEQARDELERRVEQRTADLARVNTLMEAEVAERRLTEAELRRTQSDLVQAGKLAALGQMSAALSHEINQPLAAARNYADSAAILLDRGDTDRAKGNIGQILSLIDRISAIARHLRNVARKPETPLKDITISDAVAEALSLLGPRLTGIELCVTVPDDLPQVRGGPVRLQQVLVNLISNAADAVEGIEGARITIWARLQAGKVMLAVQDNGPGVPAAIADRIFDPFFTTKRVGSGLGLGLSISYNIMKDFGGDLRVSTAATGGAVFTMELTTAHRSAEAAE